MGCFLGCFGGSKDARRRKRRNRVIPNAQRHGVQNTPQRIQNTSQSTSLGAQVTTETEAEAAPINFVPDSHEAEERSSPSPRKRVTFDSNVTTYEPVASVYDRTDSLLEKDQENSGTLREENSGSGDDSVVASSVGSYPPNHRYRNCRESDDEAEEYGDSDLEDELDDDEEFDDYDEDEDVGGIGSQGNEVWSESVITTTMESKNKNMLVRMNSEEVNSPFKAPGLADDPNVAKGARDRSAYIHPVLNPVENLAQWKLLKANGRLPVKLQKENFSAGVEAPRISFSTEPTFKNSSPGQKPNSNHFKTSNQEVAVDASLSNWLGAPETTTPSKKTHSGGLETTIASETSASQGSNSVISFEDRPILGALTVEELKQMSATASPRKSPSRSPDDMPIIGTVGTYWNDSTISKKKDSESASSFKGIPNTTSKYREDKRVNWHSTPFETRLERALNRGA